MSPVKPLMLRWLLLFGFLFGGPLQPATAHPIPRQNHDRTVLVRLTDAAVIVEYTLALDDWTLVKDLLPFRGVEHKAGPPEVYAAYARIYGPLIAQGLVAGLDGQDLRFRYLSHDLKIEDHLRYRFLFQAPLPLAKAATPRRFHFVDTNFAFEPGIFRLAVRSEGGTEISQSTAADDPEKARPVNLADFIQAQDEKLRTARVRFTQPPAPTLAAAGESAAKEKAPPPAEPVQAPVPPAWTLRRLLDPTLGMPLPFLLGVAFFFGAAHALQPGHGKTLVAAYLVGEQGTVPHALFLGLVTTLTHTSMVILLALVLPLLVPANQGIEFEVHFLLSLVCGVLVTVLALWLLLRRVAGQADHVHWFGHGHAHAPAHKPERVTLWALVMLGVAGGLVPCVDALALLTTTFVANRLSLGLPLILAFSLGLASVLVLVGVLVVKFKRFATSRFGEGRWVKSLPILSAAATLALGLWMCHDAIQQREAATSPREGAKVGFLDRFPASWQHPAEIPS